MIAGLEHHDVVVIDEIHQSMLVGDAARPGPGQQVSEWLGLADATGRFSHHFIEQPVQSVPALALSVPLPVLVVLPPLRREAQARQASVSGVSS